MENKKYLPLKVIHIALMVVALFISVIAMVTTLQKVITSSASLYYFLISITKMLALLSGIYYIVNGYKKQDAQYYKLFVFFLLAFEVVYTANQMLVGTTTLLAYCELIPLVLMTILAVGKNLGKKNTMIYAGLVFLCKVVICVTNLRQYIGLGTLNLSTTSDLLSSIILALTIIFMAIGKYVDKAERGRE